MSSGARQESGLSPLGVAGLFLLALFVIVMAADGCAVAEIRKRVGEREAVCR